MSGRPGQRNGVIHMAADTPYGGSGGRSSGPGGTGGNGGTRPPSGPGGPGGTGGIGGTGGADEGETLPVSPGSSAFSRSGSGPSSAPGYTPVPHTPAPGSRTPGGSLRAMSDKAPDRIGPYKVTKELGRGGMGQVYLGLRDDGTFQQRVAIKIVKRGMETDEITRRFELERRVLAALNHPNIARILDGGVTEDGRAYFIMEYVEGLPLDKHCDARRMTTEQRLDIFRQVCAAVQFAHQNLIVHRDIKPSNIIVTGEGVPKLMDFGIAKMLNPEMSPVGEIATAEGLRLMTPEYASPEQVRGETISTASDIYSLGVLLYELLTGHRPYRIKSRLQAEIERIICEEEPEQPSTKIAKTEQIPTADGAQTITPQSVSQTRDSKPERLKRKLEGDIDNIVMMAMRKEPQRRYRSAEQLADDIRRHLDGLPVQARKDTVSYRAVKFVRRNRFGVGAAALIAVSLVAGVIGTSWQAAVASHERDAAQKERDEASRQREIAQQERDTAQQRFNETRALARTFMYQFHDSIAPLAGSTKPRELLVTTANKYLEGLTKQAGDDLGLVTDIGASYSRVGDIQGGLRGGHLGDTAGAVKSYRTALEMFERVRKAKPDDADIKAQILATHLKLQDLLSRSGDAAGAETSVKEALALSDSLTKAMPANDGLRRLLAVSTLEMGDLLRDRGDLDAAADHYQRSLSIRRARAVEKPEDLTAKRDLSVGLVRLGDTQTARGEHVSALATRDEMVTLRRALLGVDQDSGRARRDLMWGLVWQADTQEQACEREKAIANVREAAGLAEALLAADEVNARAKRDLLQVRGRLADLLLDAGQRDAAVDLYRKRLALAAELVKADTAQANGAPGTVAGAPGTGGTESRFLLAVSHRQLAAAQAAGGQTAEAMRSCNDALALFEAISPGGGSSPQDLQIRGELGLLFRQQAELSLAAGKAAEALSHARKAADLLDPKDWKTQRTLARAAAKAGDVTAAREAYAKALDAIKTIARLCPPDDAAEAQMKAETAAIPAK